MTCLSATCRRPYTIWSAREAIQNINISVFTYSVSQDTIKKFIVHDRRYRRGSRRRRSRSVQGCRGTCHLHVLRVVFRHYHPRAAMAPLTAGVPSASARRPTPRSPMGIPSSFREPLGATEKDTNRKSRVTTASEPCVPRGFRAPRPQCAPGAPPDHSDTC